MEGRLRSVCRGFEDSTPATQPITVGLPGFRRLNPGHPCHPADPSSNCAAFPDPRCFAARSLRPSIITSSCQWQQVFNLLQMGVEEEAVMWVGLCPTAGLNVSYCCRAQPDLLLNFGQARTHVPRKTEVRNAPADILSPSECAAVP